MPATASCACARSARRAFHTIAFGIGALSAVKLPAGSASLAWPPPGARDQQTCAVFGRAQEPERWITVQLSLGALEAYRGSKFEAWKSMLLTPSCEAPSLARFCTVDRNVIHAHKHIPCKSHSRNCTPYCGPLPLLRNLVFKVGRPCLSLSARACVRVCK